MAGLKKPVKKRDTTSPNTPLVLFLVFFVLLSIGLGVWGYFGYDGQNKLRDAAKTEQDNTKAAKLGEEYAKLVASERGAALALDNEAFDAKSLEKDGKFSAEPTRAAVEKVMMDNRSDLGWDGTKYKTTYQKLVSKLRKERDDSYVALKSANDLLEAQTKRNDKIEALYKANYAKIEADNTANNKATLDAARAKTAEFEALRQKFVEIQKELENKDKEFAEKEKKYVGE